MTASTVRDSFRPIVGAPAADALRRFATLALRAADLPTVAVPAMFGCMPARRGLGTTTHGSVLSTGRGAPAKMSITLRVASEPEPDVSWELLLALVVSALLSLLTTTKCSHDT